MADLSFNVNYPKPQGQTLGEMVNMLGGMQQFQQAQQMNPLALQKAQIENQTLQQANKERLALQEFTKDPENWQTNGRIDMEKINKIIPTIAPLTGSNVLKELSGLHKSQTEATKAKQELTQSQRELIASRAGLLGRLNVQDPKIILGEMDRLKEELPDSPEVHRLIDAYAGPLSRAKAGPHIAQDMVRLSQSLLTPAQQQEALSPKAGMMDINGGFQQTVNQPYLGGNQPSIQQVGTAIPKTLGPSAVEEVSGTDIYGNPITTVKDQFGRVVGQKGVPVMGQPTPAPAPMRFAPGESPDTVKAMQAERIMAKDAAAAAAPALTNIQSVRKYLPLAATGANSEAIAKMQSVVGNIGGSKPEELAAASRDIIEKSIADLALQKNQALGGKFVEDLKGAAQSLASAGRNPTAIAKSMDQLEPLIQHAQYYQQGLENAIAKNKGDVQIKRQFDNAMINAYDPQALGAYNAYKSGGEPALNQYLMDMSPDKKKPITPGQKANIFMKIQKYVNLVNGEL